MIVMIEENPEYGFAIDFAPAGEAIAHCIIHKWTPSVCKRLMMNAIEVQRSLKQPLYAPRINDKQEKFLRFMGFYPTQALMVTTVGEVLPLFKMEVH
jgi:hypothetical protein